MESLTIRVITPMIPEEHAGGLCRLLGALFPPARTAVRRIYVSPSLATEYFMPEMYGSYDEIVRVDAEVRAAALERAGRESASLERAGFAVETAVASG